MARLEWAGKSHVGKVRTGNEDQFVAGAPVFLVADGMGGHDRGDIAAGIVADSFAALVGSPDVDIDMVERALGDAQRSVRRLARRLPTEHDMGTTLVALIYLGAAPHARWLMVNVGDSRAYRLVEGELEQISVDHSLVQEMVAAGSITASEARTHRDRNIVTRAVGIEEGVIADFTYLDIVPGERFLLTSDGVHGELTDEQIRVLLTRSPDPQSAVDGLVEAVLRGNARDNLTVVVVDSLVDEEDAAVDAARAEDDTSPIAIEESDQSSPELVGADAEVETPESVEPPPAPSVEIDAVPCFREEGPAPDDGLSGTERPPPPEMIDEVPQL